MDPDLVPQRSDSLYSSNLLEGDGEGVTRVPDGVGLNQAANLHQHFINCTMWSDVRYDLHALVKAVL